MEEEAPRTESRASTEPGSQAAAAAAAAAAQPPPPQAEAALEILIPASAPSAPSSPTPTGTLSRLGFKSPGSPTGAAPGSPIERGQVSAITVVALLDKLVNMMEAVQDNQQRMEQRQADLEGAVRVVQGDVTRLSKTHVGTSNSVNKLLERSRKVSDHLKGVRERLDKQGVQVKKLEANHSHLLKRNHFKVLIFQEDNEIPSTVMVKDSLRTPLPSQYDAESTMVAPSVTGSADGCRDETLQTVSLSSDEDGSFAVHHVDDDELGEEAGASFKVERRSDKFKRDSLKKVDSIRKAFSRRSIEKKVNQITTKIVPPEKREKIKKSLTPNHPKSPSSKTSHFMVPPMVFKVKKVRDGETPTPDIVSPSEEAHVEIPPLGIMSGEIPLAEVHMEELICEEELPEVESPSSPESLKAELAMNGESASVECEVTDLCAGLAVPESVEDVGEEEEEEVVEQQQQQQQEKNKSAAEATVETQIPTATISVEPVS
ncbi:caveolae-associated protein 2a isoform X2 [Nelusetta ayraudi]|uniref:caveolae-associated protein 2a isoform X2 n=1 Tax=Nelusetta ayraudi TaxID=303726 RepID=UPI003F6FD66E